MIEKTWRNVPCFGTVDIGCWSVQKYETENEDCWHIPDQPGPIVLCDGASESFASSLWAKTLANGLVKSDDFCDAWLANRIKDYESRINPDSLGWSRQASYERGSFATFLSVEFADGKCVVNACGDTVAFSVNDSGIIDSRAYKDKNDFLKKPILLSTRPELNMGLDMPYGGRRWMSRLAQTGASHVLMLTDAIALWLMRAEDHGEAVRTLLGIASDGEFREFVERERESKRLRFDDTTMIRIGFSLELSLPSSAPLLAPMVRME